MSLSHKFLCKKKLCIGKYIFWHCIIESKARRSQIIELRFHFGSVLLQRLAVDDFTEKNQQLYLYRRRTSRLDFQIIIFTVFSVAVGMAFNLLSTYILSLLNCEPTLLLQVLGLFSRFSQGFSSPMYMLSMLVIHRYI